MKTRKADYLPNWASQLKKKINTDSGLYDIQLHYPRNHDQHPSIYRRSIYEKHYWKEEYVLAEYHYANTKRAISFQGG